MIILNYKTGTLNNYQKKELVKKTK